MQKFSPAGGRFSVNFPAQPKVEVRKNKGYKGTTIESFVYHDRDENGLFRLVMYSDFPPDMFKEFTVDELLENAKSTAISNLNGHVVKERPIDAYGNPGIEFMYRIRTGQVINYAIYRIFFVKNRLYQIMMDSNNDIPSPEVLDEYFGSFKLL